jgi:beta-galactosidase
MAVGVYQSQVSEQLHDYVRPQESGNKSDVRWFTLTDAQGNGLKISSNTPLNVTAVPLSKFALYKVKEIPRHNSEVMLSETTNVRIDMLQMGVGGDNSWGAKPHDEFLIPAIEYKFNFTLIPLVK